MKQLLLIFVVFLCSYSVNGQILNGSFENDSAPDLSYWKSTCYDAESISNTPPGGGNWSIVVLGGNYLGCFPGYAYQKIPTITNGQTFLLSGWTLGQTARLYFGKIKNGVITLESSSETASDSWTFLSLQSTFSLSNGDTALVALHVGTIGGGEVLIGYFDLISLEQVPGINTHEITPSIKLYPNPFNNQTTLKTNKILHNVTLKMNNAFGHLVKKIENINGHTIILERDDLASGLYSIQLVENEKIIASRKIVLID